MTSVSRTSADEKETRRLAPAATTRRSIWRAEPTSCSRSLVVRGRSLTWEQWKSPSQELAVTFWTCATAGARAPNPS
jgi:hypothetical protein